MKHQTKLKQRNVVGGQNGYECKRCGTCLLAWSAKEANEMTMYPCVVVTLPKTINEYAEGLALSEEIKRKLKKAGLIVEINDVVQH